MSENLPPRPSAPAAPMQTADWEGELPASLRAAFPALSFSCHTYLGQNFLEIPSAAVIDVLRYLKEQQQFDTLTDLTAVDHPKNEQRFEIVYILYSFSKNERVRIKTRSADGTEVQSAVGIFPGANWMEREVFDMFGVRFAGHPDLKRILMPEEWNGHPLRKDTSILAMDNDWVRANLGAESGQ